MKHTIGIRLEDKNQWERRTAIVPDDVVSLVAEEGLTIAVQKSPIRAFSEDEYEKAGAVVRDDIHGIPVVIGVKEMPAETFEEGGVYVFFSHTIKGQAYNMPMLRRLMDQKCTLIDYERITGLKGRRLVFFGKWAGTAGMIDSLWALGQRLKAEGFETPLETINLTLGHQNLHAAKEVIAGAGDEIRSHGLPSGLAPLVCAFLGYGNVSNGAQEIWDLLPSEQVSPGELAALTDRTNPPRDRVFKAVFREEDLVLPVDPDVPFDLHTYYKNPQHFRSRFAGHIPDLTVIMNCVFWDKKYPRFVTADCLHMLYRLQERPRLRVIGDITCDIGGAVEINMKSTDPGNPVYTFDPFTGRTTDGVDDRGVVVLAVDNLPCELPREASTEFSHSFVGFIPSLARADYTREYDQLELPAELKKAVILHKGELTPSYMYLNKYLKEK